MALKPLGDTQDVTANNPGVAISLPAVTALHGNAGGIVLIIRNTGAVNVYITNAGQDAASAHEIQPGEVAVAGPYVWNGGTTVPDIELWSSAAALCKVDPYYTSSVQA